MFQRVRQEEPKCFSLATVPGRSQIDNCPAHKDPMNDRRALPITRLLYQAGYVSNALWLG